MKNKFVLSLMFGVLVLSVFSVGFVSAGLFKKFTITGNAVGSNGWTNWYDRDNPGGSGDWETRSSFDLTGCENPTAIQCQTVDGKSIEETGQNVICNVDSGLVCLNKENANAGLFSANCLDYRVRFYCNPLDTEESYCNSNGECTLVEGSKAYKTIDGMNYTLSIKSISATQVSLRLNDEFTRSFEEGETYTIRDSEMTILDIQYALKDMNRSKVVLKVVPEIVCGDGNLDSGEGCDDGNLNNGDGCSSTCFVESTCGNGVQDVGEQCDGNHWALGATCAGVFGPGYTGTLACNSLCKFDTSGCVAPSSTSEVTYQGVLDMLNSCEIKSYVGSPMNSSCSDVCGTSTCIAGLFSDYESNPHGMGQSLSISRSIGCEEYVYINPPEIETIHCTCCSAP